MELLQWCRYFVVYSSDGYLEVLYYYQSITEKIETVKNYILTILILAIVEINFQTYVIKNKFEDRILDSSMCSIVSSNKAV